MTSGQPFICHDGRITYNSDHCVSSSTAFQAGGSSHLLYEPTGDKLTVGRHNKHGHDNEHTAILASTRCELSTSSHCLIVGFKGPIQLKGIRHAVVSPNLRALETITVGGSSSSLLRSTTLPGFTQSSPKTIKPILGIGGDGYFTGSTHVADTVYAKDLIATGAPRPHDGSYPGGQIWCDHLTARQIVAGSVVSTQPTRLVDANLILTQTVPQIVCGAPLSRNVTITLDGTRFPNGTQVIIKDVTQFFQSGTSFNIYIQAAGGTYMEGENKILVQNGTYCLASTGGCVTLCYIAALIPGGFNVWSIISETTGLPRLTSDC